MNGDSLTRLAPTGNFPSYPPEHNTPDHGRIYRGCIIISKGLGQGLGLVSFVRHYEVGYIFHPNPLLKGSVFQPGFPGTASRVQGFRQQSPRAPPAESRGSARSYKNATIDS